MLLFLLVLALIVVVAGALGFLTGWLSRCFSSLAALRVLFAVAVLGPPAFWLFSLLSEAGTLARQFPQYAHQMTAYQEETSVFAVVAASVILWASWRQPLWAWVPLPVAGGLFYTLLWQPTFQGQTALVQQADLKGHLAFLVICVLAEVGLLGVGSGDLATRAAKLSV